MSLQIFEHLVVGALQCNCYLVGDPLTLDAIVIDPGDDPLDILAAAAKHSLNIKGIVATHAHFDHVLGAAMLRARTGAPFHLHESDLPLLSWMGRSMEYFLGVEGPEEPEVDRKLEDGDQLSAGSVELEVLHTPGHSPGSICLYSPEEIVFSGDTLFAESIGRTDLPGGDLDQELASITERLLPLGDLPVYPGHGPSTTLGREKLYNPFLTAR